MGTDWDEAASPIPIRPTARSPWTWRPIASATSSSGASSWSPASAGPTAAARRRCSPASSPRARASRCTTSRARPCSIRSGIGPHRMAGRCQGEPFAASGLRMRPRDLARIGMMMSAAAWREAGAWCRPMARAMHGTDRGASMSAALRLSLVRRRFRLRPPIGWAPARLEPWWGAFGEGGQRLFVLPGLEARRRRHRRQLQHGRPMDPADPRAARGRAGEHPIKSLIHAATPLPERLTPPGRQARRRRCRSC